MKRGRCRVRNRRGYSLLEAVLSSALLATVLVPALSLMRGSHDVGRNLETRNIMTTLCVSKLEEHLAVAARSFTNTTSTGNFAAEGYATLRFDVVRSDAVADSGIVNRLMAVTVTVYEDTNGNGVYTAGEPKVVFASKVAKMSIYPT